MMKLNKIERLSKILETSPMFQLSLSSKELFHSNFLYWIWKISPRFFRRLMEEISSHSVVLKTYDWPDDYVVKREYNHYDLCVLDKDEKDAKILLVIENKVKSIPNLNQLRDYYEDTRHADHILLSLATEFPGRLEIAEWVVSDYEKLGNAIILLMNEFDKEVKPYYKAILKDYSQMVTQLSLIQQGWCLSDTDDCFYYLENECYNRLRINDIKDKNRFSMMSALLRQKFEQELALKVEDDTSRKRIFGAKPTLDTIYINWGMTRAQGFLEVKILVAKNLALIIQIQGKQYRHAIELAKTGKNEDENWRDLLQDNRFDWFFCRDAGDTSFSPFEGSEIPLKIYPGVGNYNKYGTEFLYQSIKIPDKTTIRQLFNMVMSDYLRIRRMCGTSVAD